MTAETNDPGTELEVVTTALVQPSGSNSDIVGAMHNYQELCRALLEPSDFQTIQGKEFRKRSAWRKLAVAYGVSFEIVDRSLFWDDDGNLKAAEFIVRATAPNGRHADGWGACHVGERNAGRKAMHDIPATAETRAKNRAAADLFGMGEVSAEEIDRNAMTAPRETVVELSNRISRLERDQQDELKATWKNLALPKMYDLSDEQVEIIHSEIDAVQLQVRLDEAEVTEEAF